MLDAMWLLIELFAARPPDRSTLDELKGMLGDGDHEAWRRAHLVFDRIRVKSIGADKRRDSKMVAQYNFEEACAKTLSNLTGRPGGYDGDCAFQIVVTALKAARHSNIDQSEIIKAIVDL